MYSANFLFHSASAAAPFSEQSMYVWTSSGTSKASYFQPRFSRVALVSSAPRGAPWTSWELDLLGEP